MKHLWCAVLLCAALPLRADDSDLPRSLADEEVEQAPPPPAAFRGRNPPSQPMFSIGPEVGYMKAKGADRGTWLVGGQARFHFTPVLAAEAAMTYHDNRFQGGDVHVQQYPVQLSALLYPLPNAQFSPYLVGGGGWYYSRIRYGGSLSGLSNQTDHQFGWHAGAGLEVKLGTSASINADLRYIFLDSNEASIDSGDFNFWQATVGLNFLF